MQARSWTWALAGALAAACLSLASPSRAAAACGWSGYSYAGLESAVPAHGIGATVAPLSVPRVESGHVAAWVGVGGAGFGPNGSDAWIQVGLSAFPDTGSRLYYEVAEPWRKPRFVEIGVDVRPGQRHRVAALEMAGRPNWWRVWVDGRPVSKPVLLPGSHASWEPIATAESWDGGVPACNRYAFRFERIVLAARPGGSWRQFAPGHVFEDPGYRVSRSPAGFFASALT